MRVKDKVIVVSGGGSGLGRSLVLNLLGKGARVAAVDMREKGLLETQSSATEFGDRLSIHVLDITDKAAVLNFPEVVIARHGAVDAVINNAGIIQPFVRINALDFDAIERVMNVNFYGTLYMTKAFLPYLQKRPEAHIVNVSSMGGFVPVPGQSIYGASKAAVKLMTEALQAELMQSHLAVSVVFPGAIKTNITANSGLSVAPDAAAQSSNIKMLLPDQAAAMVVDGMEKGKVRIYVGSDSRFMNFLYRFSPGYATRMIGKKMQSLLPPD